jgi:hypothetical protein
MNKVEIIKEVDDISSESSSETSEGANQTPNSNLKSQFQGINSKFNPLGQISSGYKFGQSKPLRIDIPKEMEKEVGLTQSTIKEYYESPNARKCEKLEENLSKNIERNCNGA